MRMKKMAGILASAALAASGLVVIPAVVGETGATAQAFTCVIFANHSGGYSQADGCKKSQYRELIKGNWIKGPWENRGTRSKLSLCYVGWQKSAYDRVV